MQFMNSLQAAVSVAQLSMADTLIGVAPGEGIMPQFKGYSPEYLSTRPEAAASAAVTRCLAGKRVFIKDLQDTHELAMRRLPVVCSSSRSHNWSLCLAPSGAQEAAEDVIAAYAVSQDKRVLMPACIVIDEVLRQTFEPLELPGYMLVKNALGTFTIDKKHRFLARNNLEGVGQMHKALKNAHQVFHEFSEKWKKRTKSHVRVAERYHLDDAEFAFVTYGSWTSNAKLAVRFLREHQKEPVGLLSLRMLRPFPEDEVAEALKGVTRIAVVDNAFSLGTWSRLYQEVRTVYTGFALNVLSQFTSSANFIEIFGLLKSAEKPDRAWNM